MFTYYLDNNFNVGGFYFCFVIIQTNATVITQIKTMLIFVKTYYVYVVCCVKLVKTMQTQGYCCGNFIMHIFGIFFVTENSLENFPLGTVFIHSVVYNSVNRCIL